MKRIILLWVSTLLFPALPAAAGTMIYKNREGEEKIISNVKIVSIDEKTLTFSISSSGTETMPLGNLIRYYDTNIRSEQYDDSTADYDIHISNLKDPKTGYSSAGKGKKEPSEFSFNYSISRLRDQPPRGAVRRPYFYLFVLTAGRDGLRNFYSFSHPDQASVSMRTYDEAKMLNKVIALDRPSIHPDDPSRTGKPGMNSDPAVKIRIDKIKDETVIAWYLVGWSKARIAVLKEGRNSDFSVGKNWWIR